MAMKCCTKLETAKERCPIVFQGHPSNFKVTRYKTSPILTQIGRFRTIGQSQLSNPSDLPCLGFVQGQLYYVMYWLHVSNTDSVAIITTQCNTIWDLRIISPSVSPHFGFRMKAFIHYFIILYIIHQFHVRLLFFGLGLNTLFYIRSKTVLR